MHWQDYVFTVGSFLLIVTLIPMLRSKHGAPPWSALPIAAILYVFSATYLTLGFMLAPTIEAIQASLWVYLAWQYTTRTRREYWDQRVALDQAREWYVSAVPVVVDETLPNGTMLLINTDAVERFPVADDDDWNVQ